MLNLTWLCKGVNYGHFSALGSKQHVRCESNHLHAGEATKAKKQKRPTPKKAGPQRAQRSAVVEHFLPTSVEGVIQESSALKGALVYFVPSYSQPRYSKAELETTVARLGGKVGDTSLAHRAIHPAQTRMSPSVMSQSYAPL